MHGGQTPKISLWLTIITWGKSRESDPSATVNLHSVFCHIFQFVIFLMHQILCEILCQNIMNPTTVFQSFCHLFWSTTSCGAWPSVPFVARSCWPHHVVPVQMSLLLPVLSATSCGASPGIPFVACSNQPHHVMLDQVSHLLPVPLDMFWCWTRCALFVACSSQPPQSCGAQPGTPPPTPFVACSSQPHHVVVDQVSPLLPVPVNHIMCAGAGVPFVACSINHIMWCRTRCPC